MEVEGSRHLSASTVGSQLLDETALVPGKSWQPSCEPHAGGKKGTCHTDIIYAVEKREGDCGGQPRNYAQT